jgi:hypothetical protein
MRWHILRTLLQKELLRHVADRGGLILMLLLVCLSLLLSLGKSASQAGGLVGDLNRVYVVCWNDDPAYADVQSWFDTLKRHIPEELKKPVRFTLAQQMPTSAQGLIVFPENSGALMVRSTGRDESGAWRYQVTVWHPGDDDGALAPWEAWFWKETRRHFQPAPTIEEERKRIHGSADIRSAIATALVLFALFFACVYLLPSLTCEERERGVLLAQALSPASTLEILAAKFLFYPVLGMGLGALLAGIYRPAVLLMPFFWLALGSAAVGSLGIGLTIASLARTQRVASLGALCYMLTIAMFIFICQQNGIGILPSLALEYHVPRMLHAALANDVRFASWLHLAGTMALAAGWATLAAVLFRKRGWQ